MEDMISSDLASWPGLEPVNKGIRLCELTFEKQFVKRQKYKEVDFTAVSRAVVCLD